jgi:hypothetical protein
MGKIELRFLRENTGQLEDWPHLVSLIVRKAEQPKYDSLSVLDFKGDVPDVYLLFPLFLEWASAVNALGKICYCLPVKGSKPPPLKYAQWEVDE